jgi:hypothetical protein
MASRLTSTTNHSIEFGQNVVNSLFSILQYPFEAIQQKIQDIKNNKEKTSIKMNKIKTEIKNNFTNIKKETLSNFSKQIENLIININTLIKLFKSLSCKKNWMGYEQCDDLIQKEVEDIESMKELINTDKDIIINNIKNILNKFYNDINNINLNINDTISSGDFELKVIELENRSQEIQSSILSEAISEFSNIMKEYQLIIGNIEKFVKEKFVKNIMNKMNKKLENEEIQSDPDNSVMSGGRKNKSKKQRKSKSKKQRKNKSKTKKSKK